MVGRMQPTQITDYITELLNDYQQAEILGVVLANRSIEVLVTCGKLLEIANAHLCEEITNKKKPCLVTSIMSAAKSEGGIATDQFTRLASAVPYGEATKGGEKLCMGMLCLGNSGMKLLLLSHEDNIKNVREC